LSIQSFKCSRTKLLFQRESVRGWANIEVVALRKLRYLNAARVLSDLAAPPGNRLEPLKGDRVGQHSIRINDKWRICFVWTPAGPTDVEIVDYH
jgi:proteic killer suppression protein